MFLAAAGKRLSGRWSSATRESKPAVDFFQMLQHLVQPVCDLDHDLQHVSQLSEAANAVVHCIIVWQIKRRGN